MDRMAKLASDDLTPKKTGNTACHSASYGEIGKRRPDSKEDREHRLPFCLGLSKQLTLIK